MTKWLQDLNLLHRIVAVIHFLTRFVYAIWWKVYC